MMKLWFDDKLRAGVGDYIHVASLAAEGVKNGYDVELALGRYGNHVAALNVPGVRYQLNAIERPKGFVDIYPIMPWRNRYAMFDLDWKNKRFYYFLTSDEYNYGEWTWPKDKIRIVLQWHGASNDKFLPKMRIVLDWLASFEDDVHIVIMDMNGICPDPNYKNTAMLHRLDNIRLALAIASTAHMFVGFDSGPLYAALGNNVPSAALFPYAPAEVVALPLTTPQLSHRSSLNLRGIDYHSLLDCIDELGILKRRY